MRRPPSTVLGAVQSSHEPETERALSCGGCEVVERRCEGDQQCDAAKQYGITKMPTVVVDGQIAFEGGITKAQAELLRR